MKIKDLKSKQLSKSIGKKFDQIPSWVDPVLQGLCFWIGYQRVYFGEYPLLEGAITAEMCNLLNSRIDHNADGYLYCDVMYKYLSGVDEPDQRRADLMIVKTEKCLTNIDRNDLDDSLTTVIEVKRGNVGKKEITTDLQRLAHVKYLKPNVRAFLIIVSDGKLPNQYDWFTDSENDVTASKKTIEIDGKDAECRVRSVCMVTSKLKSKASFYSALLVEVENN